MKIQNEPEINNNVEKKEGKSLDEIDSTLKIFQKEDDLKITESEDKPKESEPQGVTPPLKTNIKVTVIPCNNLITQNEDNDNSYNEQDFNMELENSDYNYCLLNDTDNDQAENQETNLKEAENIPNEESMLNPNDLLEDNKETNTNQIDNKIDSKEEKLESNLEINKENQNQDSNNETTINNIMVETPRPKEKSQLALEIGNVIENSLTQIKKEELKEFYDLKTDDELNEFIDKAKANKDSNDLSIHPGSPSLSQLTGMNSKENGSSITPGNTYNSDFLEELTKNLPKKILAGLPNREYFITKYLNNYNNILYNPYDYKYQEVKDDGNGGYRCIALQLLGNEEFHNDIRMDVYNFLHHNKDNFTHLTFQIEGKEVTSEEYIEHIKRNELDLFNDLVRNNDILVVENIYFISGKHVFQEELLKIIMHYKNQNKTVIFTSEHSINQIDLSEKLYNVLKEFEIVCIKELSFCGKVEYIKEFLKRNNEKFTAEEIKKIIRDSNNYRDLNGNLNRLFFKKKMS